MADKGVSGLSGDTGFGTLMIRHNTLRGYDIIQEEFQMICMNRLLMTGTGLLFVSLSIGVLSYRRKGKMNAANIYKKCLGHMQDKLCFGSKK
ncbi:hypothetical protein AALA98_15755 [Lachnospiraceae bacterium 45-W7]